MPYSLLCRSSLTLRTTALSASSIPCPVTADDSKSGAPWMFSSTRSSAGGTWHRQVALVVLDHVRHGGQAQSVGLQVLLQLRQRVQVGHAALGVAVGDEDDAVRVPQQQLAGVDGGGQARAAAEVEDGLEADDLAEAHGQHVNVEGGVGLGRQRGHAAAVVGVNVIVDVLQALGLPGPSGAVVDDLGVYAPLFDVNARHRRPCHPGPEPHARGRGRSVSTPHLVRRSLGEGGIRIRPTAALSRARARSSSGSRSSRRRSPGPAPAPSPAWPCAGWAARPSGTRPGRCGSPG